MAATSLIPDASVLVKLSLPEEGSDQMAFLRDRYLAEDVELTVPSLAYFELANAFHFSKHTGGRSMEDLLQPIYDLRMVEMPHSEALLTKASRTAKTLGSSVYDATYLVVAQELDGVMVTADRDFHRRAKSRHVAMLEKVYAELAR